MRGMRRIGALGLRAGQIRTKLFTTRRSSSLSASNSNNVPGWSGSSSPIASSVSPASRHLITAGIVGGALGAAAGLFIGHATERDEAQTDLTATTTTKDETDLRRLSSLRQRAIDQEQEHSTSSPVHSARDVPWYAEVASDATLTKILDAATLLQSDHPFLEDDHMFSAFLARGIINDIEGYYSRSAQEFTAIVALGQDVSGYAGIVHGGLTAAIFDEVFGGLLFCLKTKHISIDPTHYIPSFTVNLQVDYRNRIRAGSTVLCRAYVDRVEGRKLFMRAELKDGPEGTVYATSTAIFVRPKVARFVMDVARFLTAKVGLGGGPRRE